MKIELLSTLGMSDIVVLILFRLHTFKFKKVCKNVRHVLAEQHKRLSRTR